MDTNLIEKLGGTVTPQMIDKVASATGESPENTRKAVHGAFPTVLAGLAHHGQTPDGASLLTQLREGHFAGISEKLRGGAGAHEVAASGQGLVGKIFGDRSVQASELLAGHSGIKSSSASHILALAAPLVAGALGSGGLGGMAQGLLSHKQDALAHPNAPSGLAGLFGAQQKPRQEGAAAARPPADAQGATARRVEEIPEHGREVPSRPRGRRWGGALAALGAAALVIWGVFASVRGRAPEHGVTAMQPTTNTAPPPAQAPPAPNAPTVGEGAGPAIRLPNGQTLDVAPGSAEGEFAYALSDTAGPLPQRFQFDALSFESGSASLRNDARKTMDDIAATLRAYPSSRVHVDGYTDDRGTAATNQQLSHARANSIKTALVGRGVSADRVESAGEGTREHVASNDSEQGRTRNRRSEIVLLSR